MSLLLGALAGILCALGSWPLIRWLPAGIPERLTQPGRVAERATVPVLAIACAALGAAIAGRSGWHPALAANLWLAMLMPAIVVIDIQHRVIPDLLTVPGAAAGYGLAVWAAPGRAEELALWAILGAAIVAVIVLAHPDGLGMGDAKLVLLLGAVLGRGLLVAVAAAGVVLLVPLLRVLLRDGRRGLATTVPLAPFLAVGAVAVLLAGP